MECLKHMTSAAAVMTDQKILNGKIYSKDEMNSAEYLRASDHKKTDSALSVVFFKSRFCC